MHKRKNQYAYALEQRFFFYWAFVRMSCYGGVIFVFYVLIMTLEPCEEMVLNSVGIIYALVVITMVCRKKVSVRIKSLITSAVT